MDNIIKEIRQYLVEMVPLWSDETDEELLKQLLESHKRIRESNILYFERRKKYNKIQKFVVKLFKL